MFCVVSLESVVSHELRVDRNVLFLLDVKSMLQYNARKGNTMLAQTLAWLRWGEIWATSLQPRPYSLR